MGAIRDDRRLIQNPEPALEEQRVSSNRPLTCSSSFRPAKSDVPLADFHLVTQYHPAGLDRKYPVREWGPCLNLPPVANYDLAMAKSSSTDG